MIVNIQARGTSPSLTKFSEALRSSLRVDAEGAEVLPEWLRQEFTVESTPAEKAEWLNKWRMESSEGQARMEREKGWEMSNWLYWISGENGFWEMKDIVQGDGESLVLVLEVVDWPVPVSALSWLAEKTGVVMEVPAF
ncbi:hypothetical protein ACIPPR_36595 [Streptomyces nigra]|uniref:hypothetical protein n=1 Tax=Streptomyces nigra TaxID=1827580 RepID=UPI003820B46E